MQFFRIHELFGEKFHQKNIIYECNKYINEGLMPECQQDLQLFGYINMAKIFPTFENIYKLKVKPTNGELYLLNYLVDNLSDNIEVYFQPFLNGDMPDIILMEKDVGVTIIEVKDWNLNSYYLDDEGDWYLKNNNHKIKSPFNQVSQYKDNMFNLHINGLLGKKILNKKFYGRINVFVYFHNANKQDLKDFYRKTMINIEEKISQNRDNNEKQFYFYQHKKIIRHQDYSIGNDNIKNIVTPKFVDKLFPNSIYKEFCRYLQPPYHTIEQGININYSSKQQELSKSASRHQKIKGVAGSGKTLVLARRAVNAYKRHNSSILILTFNISLTNYIHDMISDVRENFNWSIFTIIHYHGFFKMMANNYGLEAVKDLNSCNDENYFNNIRINKYKSIFIDEIQDYEVSWIIIIKKYFLEDNGELVVFGDEKQNIYDKKLANDKRPNTTIKGRWNLLKESFRLDTKIARLAQDFQEEFFKNKYDIDTIETINNKQATFDLNANIIKSDEFENNNLNELASMIFAIIKDINIHPNDVSILSSKVEILRDIDWIIRVDFNEKTLTTFETKEMWNYLNKEMSNKKTFESEINNIRRVKKYGFRLNNGMIKLSTIQSFKGWETPTLFLIINNDLEVEELIYTAITRARHNIIIFNTVNNKYYKFFKNEVNKS